jgi:FkbM family methyltransferase
MFRFFKRIIKQIIFPDFRKSVKVSNEIKKISKIERYTLTETNVLERPIKFLDSASFLFMYDEIFKKNIYKFYTTSKNPYIIDCGSNIGLSIIYFKTLYPQSKILGFEPDKNAFEVLQFNIAQFGFSNVEVLDKAVWNEETELIFYSEGADGGRIALDSDQNSLIKVKTNRLKDFLNEKIDFLKLDIEGAETKVLEDCSENLNLIDKLFIEYHSFSSTPQSLNLLLGILEKNGFRYYIQHIGIVSQHPFVKINSFLSIDNQLNIFAYRN